MNQFNIIAKRFLLNKGSAFGGIFLLLIIIGAIFAPIIVPYDWNAVDSGIIAFLKACLKIILYFEIPFDLAVLI